MKYFIYCIAFISFFLFSKLVAQTNSSHPTISDVKIAYKSIPQSTSNAVSTSFNMSVIPQATVTLVSNANVSKIYFKIINTSNNSVIYQANYSVNSAVVTNSSGRKLFENTNGIFFISNGQTTALNAYLFEITTEDNQQVMSPVYSSK